MSTPDEMRTQRKTYSVAYYEFIRGYSKNKDLYFMFFEGEDVKYYGIRIEKFTTKYIPLSCHGKENVKAIRSLIEQNYNCSKSLFFIDNDYDDETNNPENTFVTDRYSIENYYIANSCIESFLKQEMMISEIHDEYKIIIKNYIKLKAEYIKEILEINKIIIFLRRSGNTICKLNLSSFSILKYVSITLDEIKSQLTREKVKEIFNIDEGIVKDKELDKIEKGLEGKNLENILRGKFLLEFFIKYLSLIIEDANTCGGKIFNVKKTCRFGVEKATALSSLSRFAITPCTLDTFLKKNVS